MKRKMRVKGSVTILKYPKLECDICKIPYPYSVELAGSTHRIVEVPPPSKEYIVLEGTPDKGKYQKSIESES